MGTLNLEKQLSLLIGKGLNFKQEDGKLIVKGNLNGLTQNERQFLLDNKQEIIALLRKRCQPELPDIVGVHPWQDGLLSHAQRRLWLLSQMDADKGQYNLSVNYQLSGNLDFAAMETSVAALVSQHQVLRTNILSDGKQCLQATPKQCLEIVDLRNKGFTPQQIQTRLTQGALRPFRLDKDILLRAAIFRFEDDSAVLQFCAHHIAADGWSIGLLLRNFIQGYQAAHQGLSIVQLQSELQYKDYVAWLHTPEVKQEQDKALGFWKQKLNDLPVLHNLATDFPRPLTPSFAGQNIWTSLPKDKRAQLHQLANSNNVSLFMLLQAVFSLLLTRFTGESDIVMGTPVANRNNPAVKNMVGCFMNTLVLRTRVDQDGSFKALLDSTCQNLLEDFQYQETPFDVLVEQLAPTRSTGHSPLFQILFSMDNNEQVDLALPELEITPVSGSACLAQYDLTLNVISSDESLSFCWNFATDLFVKDSIQQMAESFNHLLSEVCENPLRAIKHIPLLSAKQQKDLVKSCGQQLPDLGQKKLNFVAMFEAMVERKPDATALVYATHELSYAELNQRVNKFARYLQSKGVKDHSKVAICMERGVDLMIGLLAILKLRAAYIPLDPGYPEERLDFFLRDSKSTFLLAHEELHQWLVTPEGIRNIIIGSSTTVDEIDNQPAHNLGSEHISASDAAYIIYTSGSTGLPKGVIINHGNLNHFFNGLNERFSIDGTQESWLATTSISFDISVLELFWTLSRGAKLVLSPDKPLPIESVKAVKFSLFYFAAETRGSNNPYDLLLSGAKFADENGLVGVWVPERHFSSFGGSFPNPSVAASAVAAVTKNIKVRAGSVALPLHDPIRVAEEWGMVSQLSGGRAEISVTPGWHPNDFVLQPENYQKRHKVLRENLELVKALWRGESVERTNGNDLQVSVNTLPRPEAGELPVWITAAGNPEAFSYAGSIGANIITHLLGQSVDVLEQNIASYREARENAGFKGNAGTVALMLHTFVSDKIADIKSLVEQPLKNYLRHSVNLLRPVAEQAGLSLEQDMDAILEMSFQRYYQHFGILGNSRECAEKVDALAKIGVDEIACLIDFGLPNDCVLDNLQGVVALQTRFEQKSRKAVFLQNRANNFVPYADLIKQREITHLQSTPSLAGEMLQTDQQCFSTLDTLLLGGEVLSPSLVEQLKKGFSGGLYNMYGPTEATVWVACDEIHDASYVSLGTPLLNTQLFVLDQQQHLLPDGVVGELAIAGEALSTGYLDRADLNEQKFPTITFDGEQRRVYMTGDQVRRGANGKLQFCGRNDNQVKIRGHRIELEEIEICLKRIDGVEDVAVIAKSDDKHQDSQHLLAFLVAKEGDVNIAKVTSFLSAELPNYMHPEQYSVIAALPLTPNGKIDRKALAAHHISALAGDRFVPAETKTEKTLAQIWQTLLKRDSVSVISNFFESGGHSLLATRLVSSIQTELTVNISIKDIFEQQTIRTLAALIDASSKLEQKQIQPCHDKSALQLSYQQERLWMIEQISPAGSQFNEPMALTLIGDVQTDFLQQALDRVVKQHEILLTTYHQDEVGKCFVRFNGDQTVVINVLENNCAAEDADATLEAMIQAEAQTPFNLSQDLPLRANLIVTNQHTFTLMLTMHHIVCDGWSKNIFIRQLVDNYELLRSGQPLPEMEQRLQYFDFAHWQRENLPTQQLVRHRQYWMERLADLPAIHDIPTDFPRPAIPTYRSDEVQWYLPNSLLKDLKSLATEHGCTLFMVLNAGIALLLGKYSRTTDIVVGTPVANREISALDNMMGCFMNTLVLRTQLDVENVRELLRQCKSTLLGAYEHQNYPFEKLVDDLQPERSISHTPLFQVMVSLHNNEQADLDLSDLKVSTLKQGQIDIKNDLTINMFESEDGLNVLFQFAQDLFTKSRISRMAKHLEHLLQQMVADTYRHISELNLATDDELLALEKWQTGARVEVQPDHCVQQLSAVVANEPELVALSQGAETLNFREFQTGIQRLSCALLDAGVSKGDFVAVVADQSMAAVVACWAVMETGAAYVPIDIQTPESRFNYCLNAANIEVMLVSEQSSGMVPDCDVDMLFLPSPCDEEAWFNEYNDLTALDDIENIGKDDVAYLIFTSGSTGNPKAVPITHGNLNNYLAHSRHHYLDGVEQALVSTSLGFDATVTSILAPLAAGCSVVLPETDAEMTQEFSRFVTTAQRPALLKLTPAHLSAVLDSGVSIESQQAHRVVIGGEQLRGELLDALSKELPNAVFINEYGPTETTVGCATHIATRPFENYVGIGCPIQNISLLVIDEHGNRVPPGVPGELCIGGDGTFGGYYNNQELTSEKIFNKKDNNGQQCRYYRSGDQVMWGDNGCLHYLGRVDGQIKIRGYRVELGEIESVIGCLPNVEQAIVVADNFTQLLFGFVKVTSSSFSSADVLSHCRQQLPAYMVPADIFFVDQIPLTINGKVNKKALLKHKASVDTLSAENYQKTVTEQQLCDIWQELLGKPALDVQQSFFELGGHSLLVTRMVSAIRKAWSVEIKIRDIFDLQTASKIAGFIDSAQDNAVKTIPMAPVAEHYPLSFAQNRLWLTDKIEGQSAQYHVPFLLHFEGDLDAQCLQSALQLLIKRHEVLRTSFRELDSGQVAQFINDTQRSQAAFSLQHNTLLPEQKLQDFALHQIQQRFDLANDLMIRANLIRESSESHYLLVTIHHIATDGWSVGLLTDELCQHYQSFLKDIGYDAPAAEIQYKDFAVWQQQQRLDKTLDPLLQHWYESLEGAPQLHDLPLDRPRQAHAARRGATQIRSFSPELSGQLKQFAQQRGMTLYMLLNGLLAVVMKRYSGQNDIVIGAPVAGREHHELEKLSGCFINTLPVRMQLQDELTFEEVMELSKSASLNASEYQQVPFELLVDELKVEKSLSYTPVFQVMLSVQNQHKGQFDIPGLKVSGVPLSESIAQYELLFNVIESDAIEMVCEYALELFNETTVLRILTDLECTALAMLGDTQRSIGAFPLTSASLVNNRTTANAKNIAKTPWQEQFSAQAKSKPGNMAVLADGESFNYGEINEWANQLANLLHKLGVKNGDKVAVCLPRSKYLVPAILGVAKVGAAFIPLEYSNPQERIDYILSDADIRLVLTTEDVNDYLSFEDVPSLKLDSDMFHNLLQQQPVESPSIDAIADDDLAYILYTSGSTGKPKGVLVEHQNLINYLSYARDNYVLPQALNGVVSSAISFDATLTTLLTPLISGTCVEILSEDNVLEHLQHTILDAQQAKLFKLTPSHLQAISNLSNSAKACGQTHTLVVGGESLAKETISVWLDKLPNGRFINEYGPTETVVGCTTFEITQSQWADLESAVGNSVPIGHPIWNTQVEVVNSYGMAQPVNVIGELVVIGDSVGRGYQTSFSEGKLGFVEHQSGQRAYHTGDLVRYREDGALEYVGRSDEQTNLRGFRIEMDEIRQTALSLEVVRDAFVTIKDEQLVVFFVSSFGEQVERELKAHFQKLLPLYMQPKVFVFVEELPTNKNGKVDVSKLPEVDVPSMTCVEYRAPETNEQQILCDIWQNLFGLEKVGISEDFFDLGGHSLLATQLVAEVRERLSKKLAVRQVFEQRSIEGLANELACMDKVKEVDIVSFASKTAQSDVDEFELD